MDNKNENMTKKQKADAAGKDVAEMAAKGFGQVYGGKVGGKAVEMASKTRGGQRALEKAGKNLSNSSPVTRNFLAKNQQNIHGSKPFANSLMGGGMGEDLSSSNDDNIDNGVEESNDSSNTTGGNGVISSVWKKLPFKYKMIAIGVIACFILFVTFLILFIAPLMYLDIIPIGDDSSSSYDSVMGPTYDSSENTYYWPVGSADEKDGFATGEPYSTKVISNYGSDNFGIDIDSNGASVGVVNVVSVKPGEVIYPTDASQTQYDDNGSSSNTDGNGYGNFVKIKHSDGTYTLYAHLAKNSITVTAGDVVSQGQIIGKMGSSGSASDVYLHFEIRNGSDSVDSAENPLDYIDPENSRPKGYGNSDVFSITSTSLSKNEFVNKMNDYCKRSKHTKFCNNFAKKASSIYDTSIKNNVNPELVVVTAGTEQGWYISCNNNNYWGINVTNTGGGCGTSYATLEDGIAGYAKLLNSYTKANSSMINKRYEQRKKAGCDPSGHGPAGSLVGMQSVYSWIGTYRYDPGGSSRGGCYILNHMYGKGYCSKVPTCKDYNNCPANSATTVCEQNDYTAYQVKQKMDIRYDIFGL